mmetsp:Transcript_61071/g.170442  ORF Transcript_61071/g.170442 Transcript_61071/m.170442 type:complete len:398 (-) Transcript_61071:342-1535(-)
MLVILEGSVELESKAGAKIGQLRAGGVLGEVEALGLFGIRTATCRALEECLVLTVTEEALQSAVEGPGVSWSSMRAGFARLLEGRRAQVETGLPLCALPLTAQQGSVAVTAVALHAERLPTELGDTWEPLPDTHPCGPHVVIVTRGRLVLEIQPRRGAPAAETEAEKAAPVPVVGGILPEGAAAKAGAQVRVASSDCEAYRVRMFDLAAAAHFSDRAPSWFYHFRSLEKEARQSLGAKLASAREVMKLRMPHPVTSDIIDWSDRRHQSVSRARKIRYARADSLDKNAAFELPMLAPADFGTTAFRSRAQPNCCGEPPKRSCGARESKMPKPPSFLSGMSSLEVYPAMGMHKAMPRSLRLPRIESEPALRGPGIRRASAAQRGSSMRRRGADSAVVAS